MRRLGQNLRYAARQLQRSPGFALAVIVTLALGIGVNTAVFSLVNASMLRRLPYPEPDRLGALLLHTGGVGTDGEYHNGITWNWVNENLPSAKAASYSPQITGVNLSTTSSPGGQARYVHEMRVSARYFDVLGLPLMIGREFTGQEDQRGGPPVVILSYALWHEAPLLCACARSIRMGSQSMPNMPTQIRLARRPR